MENLEIAKQLERGAVDPWQFNIASISDIGNSAIAFVRMREGAAQDPTILDVSALVRSIYALNSSVEPPVEAPVMQDIPELIRYSSDVYFPEGITNKPQSKVGVRQKEVLLAVDANGGSIKSKNLGRDVDAMLDAETGSDIYGTAVRRLVKLGVISKEADADGYTVYKNTDIGHDLVQQTIMSIDLRNEPAKEKPFKPTQVLTKLITFVQEESGSTDESTEWLRSEQQTSPIIAYMAQETSIHPETLARKLRESDYELYFDFLYDEEGALINIRTKERGIDYLRKANEYYRNQDIVESGDLPDLDLSLEADSMVDTCIELAGAIGLEHEADELRQRRDSRHFMEMDPVEFEAERCEIAKRLETLRTRYVDHAKQSQAA